jgi:16S rRNA (adenine1518-N6/adenine1519-N6)-dimethyltransferase
MTETPPRPKKSWGQHFLIDYNIQRKILDTAQIQPGERIVEIGPGRGILTQGLLDRGAEVTAIEIDPLLIQPLREQFPRLHLVQADALRYAYDQVPAPYKVVANLPYNISTPLLFQFLEERTRISRMVLMLQREVAARLVASVGSKTYGALSAIFQFYADLQIAFIVPRTCFRPRPQVDSAVVTITPLPAPRVSVRNEAYFIRVVKGAFGHRRKQLVNALADAGFDRKKVEEALAKTGIAATRRGETLTLPEFAHLADILIDYEGHL